MGWDMAEGGGGGGGLFGWGDGKMGEGKLHGSTF